MRDAQPKAIFLTDYKAPNFLIEKTDLKFDLYEQFTLVSSRLKIINNSKSTGKTEQSNDLVLNGQDLELIRLMIDNKELTDQQYKIEDEKLILFNVPNDFEFFCETKIKPQENTSLEGLYKSQHMFCTQCEAEGFRKITYYLDRPDVMSEFTTTICAEKNKYPVLLSNGNLIDEGIMDSEEENGATRHFSVWHDPFKKPCYLFALVAGNLEFIEDHFTTLNNKSVRLRIYVETKDLDKCDYAMKSLKSAMKWDEDIYGREYDLDLFNIVAVDDFNMGAMENKGLNIFNTSCVLAHPKTTTDSGFMRVEAVVAHEYFHNWSGNRVTCRDWFQLSLKEGFTVFRDAEFSADMNSAQVKRIEDANFLRTLQFAEDSSPTAHPVQPDSYMEINNFYTLTVYEKGAEIVRMLRTLLGPDTFRKGSDLYFERHDGQAVTIEHFVAAMEAASGRDLTDFMSWYKQAGTPVVNVSMDYNSTNQEVILHFTQDFSGISGTDKKPYLIPVKVAMLDDDGNLMPLVQDLSLENPAEVVFEKTLEITQVEQEFKFYNVKSKPVPSLLRGFSAPVKLHYSYTRDELMQLMGKDSDGFNQWDAGQQLASLVIFDIVDQIKNGLPEEQWTIDNRIIEAASSILQQSSNDPALAALALTLPAQDALYQNTAIIDPLAIFQARKFLKNQLAKSLFDDWLTIYNKYNVNTDYEPSAQQIGQRSLKNLALSFLLLQENEQVLAIAETQFKQATNMTDRLSVLEMLANNSSEQAQKLAIKFLEEFYSTWRDEALVVNQWFRIQATVSLPGALDRVKELISHEAFVMTNPNKVRSLIGSFVNGNHWNFHQLDGKGYDFLADQVINLNSINPQIAARLVTPFTKWKQFTPSHSEKMELALKKIMKTKNLSPDVFELVSKSLDESE